MTTTDSVPMPVAAPIAEPARGFGLASAVLGAASLVAGWALPVAIVGLVLGVLARKREPQARSWSTAGIIINAVALGIWVLAGLGVVALGALAIGARLAHHVVY